MPKYVPARGGHSPGHLRYMFLSFLETGDVPTGGLFDPSVIADRDPIDWLCGQLWNCTDQMPGGAGAELLDATRLTYAQAARLIRRLPPTELQARLAGLQNPT